MIGIILIVAGIVLTLVGWVQGVMAGFRKDTLWGVLNVFFSPLTPAIMAIQEEMSWRPVLFMVGGGLLASVGQVVSVAQMFR